MYGRPLSESVQMLLLLSFLYGMERRWKMSLIRVDVVIVPSLSPLFLSMKTLLVWMIRKFVCDSRKNVESEKGLSFLLQWNLFDPLRSLFH